MRAHLLVAATLAAFLPAGPAAAQDKSAELAERYEKKLQKDFCSKAEWQSELAQAMKKAADGKKLIFGYFTRSYSP
jgi:ribosomal protein S17E